MTIRTNYKHTIAAGYIGYITQAVVNNFAPLLFVTFQRDWQITLSQLAFISTYNFAVQLLIDLLSAKYADRFGIRQSMVFAHVCAALGLAGLGTLPFVMTNHFAGLLIAITLYAIGGGLIEVLVSPVIEACPTENKEANMSLLHSFYCWGQLLTVLISTVFFAAFDISNWRILAFIWAVIPAVNAVYFSFVPIAFGESENTAKTNDKNKKESLFKNQFFYILVIMMICAGAAEIAVAQWASAFAEDSLGITKAAGDIAGPCFFALLMGVARTVYAKFSKKLPLEKYILFCAVLCLFSYMMISLSPIPVISLLGCGIAGFAVGIMWPGTYSIAAKNWKNPSTSLFALLALAGDCGCSTGPFVVGAVSERFGNDLHMGFLTGSVFPIAMIIAVIFLLHYQKKHSKTL